MADFYPLLKRPEKGQWAPTDAEYWREALEAKKTDSATHETGTCYNKSFLFGVLALVPYGDVHVPTDK